MVLGYALHRFWRVSRDIEQAQYVPRYRSVLLLTIGMLALGGASALWLFPL